MFNDARLDARLLETSHRVALMNLTVHQMVLF